MIGIIFYGAIGYFLFCALSKKETGDVGEQLLSDPESQTNLSLLTQPQQKFPLQKVETPRVDNADQPWYVDSRAFMGKQDLSFENSESRDANVTSYGTNDFWRDIESKYWSH